MAAMLEAASVRAHAKRRRRVRAESDRMVISGCGSWPREIWKPGQDTIHDLLYGEEVVGAVRAPVEVVRDELADGGGADEGESERGQRRACANDDRGQAEVPLPDEVGHRGNEVLRFDGQQCEHHGAAHRALDGVPAATAGR